MRRDEVLSILTAHQQALKDECVKSLDLFGSVARDEADPESDVDFLVEFVRPFGLFQFIQVRLFLEDILGRSVDIGTRKSLRDQLQESVLKDAIRVF